MRQKKFRVPCIAQLEDQPDRRYLAGRATNTAMGAFRIRILLSSDSSGRRGVDGGLSEPILEANVAQPCVGTRHQRPLAQLGAEVARLRVGGHHPWILAGTETQSDAFVKAQLLWPPDLYDAVHWSRHGDPTYRLSDVVRRYGLEPHASDSHRIPVGGLVCDALQELAALRGAHR